MVDYSKWDKLEVSSDEEEEEGTTTRTQPSVYRVGPSGSVTIPGRNVTVHSSSSSSSSAPSSTSGGRAMSGTGATGQKAIAAPKTLTSNGGAMSTSQAGSSSGTGGEVKSLGERRDVVVDVTLDTLTRNGAETPAYFWSQTSNTVRISFVLENKSTRAKDVTVHVDSDTGEFDASADGWAYKGTLFGPIAPLDEPEDLDWSLATVKLQRSKEGQQQQKPQEQQNKQSSAWEGEGLRLLQVDLVKKDLSGIVMWWKSAFKGDPEIDTTAIADRSKQQEAASATFADNFKKAQEMFLQRIRSGEARPPPLDIGSFTMDTDHDDADDDADDAGDGDEE
ncbi:hypothetical protein PTSG_05881 [Salpingoeca rosetta]|uniref:CS domain-containing protein n=1 Tax=Salpingoeca rosetta (strain ATCC 50818 / BSB-021) TaxID=946362 RepID=F2UD22_SALR5|nr:uncharacterized protein PTSG_05881 [Salpingoeca rosetta]EGD74517.1 hypothetical protein PTSG_05881 [Salpingoeca rosetta]|eukprot:XP_004992774.1 hypothetical protein PTSG_05881 [Salpingoeca rosetta]